MVALRAADISALPLLVEPERPTGNIGRSGGWRVSGWRLLLTDEYERNHDHDPRGAMAQHIVARYYLGGVDRARLAADYGYSVRQIQFYLSGKGCRFYTRPIFSALRELGLPTTHRGIQRSKLRALVVAQSSLLADAADLMQWRVIADRQTRYERFIFLARLMTFVGEGPV